MLTDEEMIKVIEPAVRRWIREEMDARNNGMANVGNGTYTIQEDGTFMLNGVRMQIHGWNQELSKVSVAGGPRRNVAGGPNSQFEGGQGGTGP